MIAAPHHYRPCGRVYTIAAYHRWVRRHARDGRIPTDVKPAMWRLEACQAHRQPARLVAIRWRLSFLRRQRWNLAHPWQTAVASWYLDQGPTASGWHATYGFAACGSIGPCFPFGTRIKFCLGGRCVVATLDDHGPYVDRNFDLGASTAQAIGFQGVQTVRFRLLPEGAR